MGSVPSNSGIGLSITPLWCQGDAIVGSADTGDTAIPKPNRTYSNSITGKLDSMTIRVLSTRPARESVTSKCWRQYVVCPGKINGYFVKSDSVKRRLRSNGCSGGQISVK